jgi:hypothetical protein
MKPGFPEEVCQTFFIHVVFTVIPTSTYHSRESDKPPKNNPSDYFIKAWHKITLDLARILMQ